MSRQLPKIIVILGPTASGKTELAIKLAQKFGGEIISADSRQVYREMRIATGKPVGEWQLESGQRAYFVSGVPHHLMDIINPDQEFSLADFINRAKRKISEIIKRGKLPIIAGGTGLYISALVNNLAIAPAPPDRRLRDALEAKPLLELVRELERADPNDLKIVDLKNKRRVIRALELVKSGQSLSALRRRGRPLYNPLLIGLGFRRVELNERIDTRIESQVKAGMLGEARELLKKYPAELPSLSGIGYHDLKEYLDGKITEKQAIENIKNKTHRYAKRQITWFKRDRRINWLKSARQKNAERLASEFLKRTD